MLPREFVAVTVASIITIAVVALAWKWISSRKTASKLRWDRWLGSGLTLLVAGPLILWGVGDIVSEGDYLCLRCRRSFHAISVASIRLPISSEAKGYGVGPDSDEYEAAFLSADQREHSHVWHPVGCHRSGVLGTWRVSCMAIGPTRWYRDLLVISDRELARATAIRFAHLSDQERKTLLHWYGPYAVDGSTPDERFASWRSAWRRDHADWP